MTQWAPWRRGSSFSRTPPLLHGHPFVRSEEDISPLLQRLAPPYPSDFTDPLTPSAFVKQIFGTNRLQKIWISFIKWKHEKVNIVKNMHNRDFKRNPAEKF
ncbi:hypothetical protein CDAR_570811 [Caerostris darwini]|uniref:Uncharacterized protein n=1 Tax=Caerostris darwini TaxID=1538125 RepID=A0AAV4QDR1_9ARAC|nr:hypothetical protein CDAR_570811 [Caerostris darwini]